VFNAARWHIPSSLSPEGGGEVEVLVIITFLVARRNMTAERNNLLKQRMLAESIKLQRLEKSARARHWKRSALPFPFLQVL
jgi:hypothetical protein